MSDLTAADEAVFAFWFDQLGMCGCDDPAAVLEEIRDALRAVKARTLRVWVDSPARSLIAYLLDSWDLAAHATSASYSGRLTEKGEELLAALEACDMDAALDN